MTPAQLTEARKALNLTQVGLARALGVHANLVNRWERGHAKIPAYLWLALEGLRGLRTQVRMCETLADFANPDRWIQNAGGRWVWRGDYPPFERPAMDLAEVRARPVRENHHALCTIAH